MILTESFFSDPIEVPLRVTALVLLFGSFSPSVVLGSDVATDLAIPASVDCKLIKTCTIPYDHLSNQLIDPFLFSGLLVEEGHPKFENYRRSTWGTFGVLSGNNSDLKLAFSRPQKDRTFTASESERHIRTAIAYWVANFQSSEVLAQSSDGSYEGYKERPIQVYDTVDEFIAANPDCCFFGSRTREGYQPSPWFKFRNDYLGIVTIDRIKMRFADNDVTIDISGVAVLIDEDGHVIEIQP